ncbi:MAG: PadR family transcriptional regulator [Propionibacteriaceae bacterium]|jgi:PadR family transcriptional regulator PadR|nr:PadR family transcriptional regulator [Propionibacteriaceae bacterium]
MDGLTEMLKGVLEGCVLDIISRQSTYGYEITKQLNALGFDEIVEGTVYTILLRLERNALVSVERRSSQVGPPRKFYDLTAAGQQELTNFWQRWDFINTTINQLRGEQS